MGGKPHYWWCSVKPRYSRWCFVKPMELRFAKNTTAPPVPLLHQASPTLVWTFSTFLLVVVELCPGLEPSVIYLNKQNSRVKPDILYIYIKLILTIIIIPLAVGLCAGSECSICCTSCSKFRCQVQRLFIFGATSFIVMPMAYTSTLSPCFNTPRFLPKALSSGHK